MTTAVWKSKPVLTSVVLLLVIVLAGIFAPGIAPHDPNRQNLPARLLPPAWLERGEVKYLLGTDRMGRDVLSRLIHGARIALVVSLIPALVAGVIGATLGLLAGYFGRRTDARGIRLAEFPPVIFAILPVLLGLFLVYSAMVLVAVGVPGALVIVALTAVLPGAVYFHQVRKETQRTKGDEAVRRAWEGGASHVGVIIRHIFPRVANYLVLLAPPAMTYAIVLESVMSWLGIGLPRPTPSWGLMAADGRDLLPSAWWVSAFPALVILLVVLSLALLARRLKDQVVPRLKE